eukprot:TRINITY_DN3603_c0_g1_i4.p1 TRINITY_DN3603_c0_g1~~TRINITY_DN3603_c0_g1_i4.p1  ORF type:complete len:4801 (-),score=871.08 TRINITY_DN3603_c0_g1_i4:39-14441(-)
MGASASALFNAGALDESLIEDQEWLHLRDRDLFFDEVFVAILDAALRQAEDRPQWYVKDLGLAKRSMLPGTCGSRGNRQARKKLRERHLDDLLIGLVEFEQAQLQQTTERIGEDLAHVARSPSLFAVRLKKRFHLAQRIQLALLRQHARQQESRQLETRDITVSQQLQQEVSPVVQISVRLFRCLLQTLHHMEASFIEDILVSFQDILSKLPPLSLRSESSASLDALHHFLHSFTVSASLQDSADSVAPKPTVTVGHDRLTAQAITSLIMLGIARGSTTAILWVVNYLVAHNNAASSLPIKSYLLKWLLSSQQYPQSPASSNQKGGKKKTSASPNSTFAKIGEEGSEEAERETDDKNKDENALLALGAGNRTITAFSDKHFVGSWTFHCKNLKERRVKRKKKKDLSTEEPNPYSPPPMLHGGLGRFPPYMGENASTERSTGPACERNDELLSGPEPYDPRQAHLQGQKSVSASIPGHCSLATDGTYLFILDASGLARVGTGLNDTIQGYTYASEKEYRSKEKGWIAYAGDKLYYRSSQIAPATLLVLNPQTLKEEGQILQDGTGSVPTCDNRALFFGPESSATATALAEKETGTSEEGGDQQHENTVSNDDGEGDIDRGSETSNTATSLATALATDTPLAAKEKTLSKGGEKTAVAKAKNAPVARSPIISDGKSLYIVHGETDADRQSGGPPQHHNNVNTPLVWRLSSFDPAQSMSHLRTVTLNAGVKNESLWSKSRVSYVSCNSSSARFGSTATLVGKKIFVLGGRADYMFTAGTDILDVANADAGLISWTQPPTTGMYTGALDCHTAVLVSRKEDPSGRAPPPPISNDEDLYGMMPHDRNMAAQVRSKKFLVIFGGKNESSVLNNLYNMDPDKATWLTVSATGSVPPKRFSHAAAVEGGEGEGYRMWIFGGYDCEKRLNDLFVLDTATNKWEKPQLNERSVLPSGRSGATFTWIGAKTFLMYAGYDGSSFLSDVYTFSLETMSWSRVQTTGEKPKGRAMHSANLIDRRLYIFGGRISATERTNDVYYLDLNTWAWIRVETGGTLPTARASHCAVAIGSKLLVIGGRDEDGPTKGVFTLQTNESVLFTKDVLNGGISFFTNGEYLGALLPPGLFPNPSCDDSMLLVFNAKDGKRMFQTFVSQQHALETGMASCYDPSALVWNYSADTHKVGRWFEKFTSSPEPQRYSPEHILSEIAKDIVSPLSYSIGGEAKTNSQHAREEIHPESAALLILANLDRLTRRFIPSLSDLLVQDKKVSLTEPFCVEVKPELFRLLHTMLSHFAAVSLETAGTSGNKQQTEHTLYILLACLRLLKANIHRLIISRVEPSAMFVKPEYQPKADVEKANDGMDLLTSFRKLLLGLVHHSEETVRQEASGLLIVAFEIFYPSAQDKTNLLLSLLSSGSSDNKYDSLLAAILGKYAEDASSISVLVVPSESESSTIEDAVLEQVVALSLEEPSGAKEVQTWAEGRNGVLFLRDVLALVVKEAESSLSAQQQAVAPVSTSMTTATIATHVSPVLSSALRLLQLIQKDLLSRAGAAAAGTSPATSDAAVASICRSACASHVLFDVLLQYSKLVIEHSSHLIELVSTLHIKATVTAATGSKSDNTKKRVALAASVEQHLKHSLVGEVLPMLLTSLCLIPDKITWAHRLLQSAIQLVANLDALNALLPVLQRRKGGHFATSSHWLLDLEKTAAHFAGMLVAAAVGGDKAASEESQYNKWLESKLLSKGLEEAELELDDKQPLSEVSEADPMDVYLKTFIGGTGTTNVLIQHMEDFLRAHELINDRDGDEDPLEAQSERTVLAALLKHEGLIPDVMNYNSYLVKVKGTRTIVPVNKSEGSSDTTDVTAIGSKDDSRDLLEELEGILNPPISLVHLWLLVNKEVRMWLQRNKVLSAPISSSTSSAGTDDWAESEAAPPPTADSSASSSEGPVAGDDATYNRLVKGVIDRAAFLLKIKSGQQQSATAIRGDDPVANGGLTSPPQKSKSVERLPSRTRAATVQSVSPLKRSSDSLGSGLSATGPKLGSGNAATNHHNSLLDDWRVNRYRGDAFIIGQAVHSTSASVLGALAPTSAGTATNNNTAGGGGGRSRPGISGLEKAHRGQNAATVTQIKAKLSATHSGQERALVKFVQSQLAVSSLVGLISRRRKRAERRKAGLDAMCQLLKTVSVTDVKREALKFLPAAFRTAPPNAIAAHYLANVLPCGIELERELRSSLQNLFQMLALLLKAQEESVLVQSTNDTSGQAPGKPLSSHKEEEDTDIETDEPTSISAEKRGGTYDARHQTVQRDKDATKNMNLKLVILDIWGSVEFREDDHMFLHRVGIFSILCRFMSLFSAASQTRTVAGGPSDTITAGIDPKSKVLGGDTRISTTILTQRRGFGTTRQSARETKSDTMRNLQRAAWLTFRFSSLGACLKDAKHTKSFKQAPTDASSNNTNTSALEKDTGEFLRQRGKVGQSLNELQNTIFELLFAEIEKINEQAESGCLVLEIETPEEAYVFDLLSLLHTISDTEASQAYIASKRLSGLLLNLMLKSSPRIQRMLIRLCRRVMPRQDPERLFGSLSRNKSIIASFLELIGTAYWHAAKTDKATIDVPIESALTVESQDSMPVASSKIDADVTSWRDGQAALALASELVLLLRLLLGTNNWRAALTQALTSALRHIPAIVKYLETDVGSTNVASAQAHGADVVQAIAALCVIGGHCWGLRVGARVDVVDKTKKTRGTIIVYDRINARARVLTDKTNVNDKSRSVPSWVALNKLSPINELPDKAMPFTLTSELLPSFACFLTTSTGSSNSTNNSPEMAKAALSDSLLFALLKSRALKALDFLLSQPESVACLLDSDLLPLLIKIAQPSNPVKMESSSIDKLEEKAIVLDEKCYEIGPDVVDNAGSIATLPSSDKHTHEADTPISTTSLLSQQQQHSDPDAAASLTASQQPPPIAITPSFDVASMLSPPGMDTLTSMPTASFPFGPAPGAVPLTNVPSVKATRNKRKSKGSKGKERVDQDHDENESESADAATESSTTQDRTPHSPFRYLPFKLPLRMICEGTANMLIDEDDPRTFTCLCRSGNMAEVGIMHSDAVIPDALPAFYFEIRVVEDGRRAHNNGIGIGLFPAHEKIYGMPGWYNGSVGYNGQNGFKFHSRNTGSGEMYGPSFGRGDVVGCGWTKWDGRVFFTKNGQHLGTAFKHIYGRFYAVVGAVEYGSRVTINFGQEPFRYNFGELLKKTFLKATSETPTDSTETSKEQSESEATEGATAKKIESTPLNKPPGPFGQFGSNGGPPQPLFSFGRGRDPHQGMWSSSFPPGITYGNRPPFGGMGMAAPVPPQPDNEEDEFDLSDDEGGAWTRSTTTSNMFANIHRRHRLRAEQQVEESLSDESEESDEAEEEEDEEEQDIFGGGLGGSMYQRYRILNSRRYRNPQGKRKKRTGLQSQVNIEKLKRGTWLNVRSSVNSLRRAFEEANMTWFPDLARTLHKTGAVLETNVASQQVLLELYNGETGTRRRFWYPLNGLCKPPRPVNHPYQELKSSLELKREVIYTVDSLFNSYARNTVLSVISNWPEAHAFSLEALGGYERLLDVLELAASECLSVNASDKSRSKDKKWRGGASAASGYHGNSNNNAGNNNKSASTSHSSNFVQRMGSITSIKMLGLKLQELLGEELSEKITQQESTHSDWSIPPESFAYKICQECLRHLRDSATLGVHWVSGFNLLPDNALVLNTKSGESDKKPSILLGTWLLDLLLEHTYCNKFIKSMFFVDIYDALLNYVSTKTTPSKGRVFPLLAKLLKACGGFPANRSPSASQWKVLETQMRNLYSKEKTGNSALHSYCLQRLSELMVVRQEYIQLAEKDSKAQKTVHKTNPSTAVSSPVTTSTSIEATQPISGAVDTKGKDKEIVADDSSAVVTSGGEKGNQKEKGKEKAENKENENEKELVPMMEGGEGSDTDWFENMLSIADVMHYMSRRDRLPLPFMCRVWLETQTPFVIIESSHPYGEKEVRGKVQIPDASSLIVTFDKESKIDNSAYLYLSKLEDGGENLHKFCGAMAVPPLKIEGSTFYYQFQPRLPGIGAIHDFYCYSCNESPISDVLYSCSNCETYLCASCEDAMWTSRSFARAHPRNHVFYKISRPLPVDSRDRYNHVPLLYHAGETVQAPPSIATVEHPKTSCNKCNASPIVGIRFKCANCPEYNLCEKCEKAEAGSPEHDRGHVYLKIRCPLKPHDPDEADAPPPFEPVPSLYPDSNYWGYKFTVVGKYTKDKMKEWLKAHKEEVMHAVGWQDVWTPSMDLQLTQYINHLTENKNQSPLTLTVKDLEEWLPPEALYPSVAHVPLPELHLRVALAQQYNVRMQEVIRLIDLSQCSQDWSLGAQLSSLRYMLFNRIKTELWNDVIGRSHYTSNPPSITLNRRKAAEERERRRIRNKGDDDSSGADSKQTIHEETNDGGVLATNLGEYAGIFVQAFHQLNDLDPGTLRSNGQAWNVQMEGESGIDVGGVFRDTLTEFCTELCSSYFPMFIKSPNARDQQGKHREKFVPNPRFIDPLSLAMYEFVGKLMGVALRTKELLPLDLPTMLWKPLVGLDPSYGDLEEVDVLACRGIEILKNDEALQKEGVTQENFEDTIGFHFTTNSTDGREIELKERGRDTCVTWEHKNAYADLVLDYRLHEFELQVAAIKNGLDTIVPTSLLSLFTPQELELAVCGRPDIDISILKKNTKYNGCSETTKEVEFFWETLRSFSQEERSLFLRFVWGRSRLPVQSEWPTKFTLRLLKNEGKERDSYLPSAHTCFFSLDLPVYSSAAILKEKLLKAITMCTSVENI